MLDSLDIPAYNHVIILCYSDSSSLQQADARTLITLLHLRDIAERCGQHFSIVSEMLDVRNRNLAEVTRADDFIVSDRLVSLMLAQISENRQLNRSSPTSSTPKARRSTSSRPATTSKQACRSTSTPCSRRPRRRHEIAFGYRRKMPAQRGEPTHTVVMNPNKAAEIVFADGDSVIVFAEE